MSKWKYAILLIVASAVGCSSQPKPLPVPDIVVEKPKLAWPAPVQPVRINSFKFENIDGKVWAMMDYQDYIKFSKGQVIKERFVKDLMTMVCYYQPDKQRCSFLEK